MDNWFKIEFLVQYRLKLSPLEMERMEFYRIELLLSNWEKQAKKEKEDHDRQQREQDKQAKAQQAQSKPKANYGGFKIPK